MDKVPSNLNTYIKKITERTSLDRMTTERVINTQIALLFSDLAVTGKSECFLGTLHYREGEIILEPNALISGLVKGEVDPNLILKEIFENV